MSEVNDFRIPSSWTWASLNELGTWAGGGTPSKGNPSFWSGKVPWVSPKDMKCFEIHDTEDHITQQAIQESATSKLPVGTVLMVTRSGILRHTFPVAVSRVPVTLNQDLKALTPHQELHADFIGYALRCLGSRILHSCTKDGTTVQSIESSALKRFQIPVAPEPEQRRVVQQIEELFSDLDAGVAALERVRQKLGHYRAAVLKAAVEGALTAAWRKQNPKTEPASALLERILAERRRRWEQDQLRKFKAADNPSTSLRAGEPSKNWKAKYKEPVAPDTTNLPPLPKGWCWATLDQVFRVERGRFSIRPRNDPRYYGGKEPFVQIGNLPRDGGPIRAYSQTLNSAGLAVSKKFPAGTVLIAIVGATIGNTGILSFDSCCPDSLVALQSSSPALLQYAESFLQSRKLHLRISASASGGQPNINLELLHALALPLPPIGEIEAIVEAIEDQLSVIEHLERDVEAKLKSAQVLRQAILRHAFTGRLVPQDPKDEPASELLKRIAAERAEPQSNPKFE